MSPSTSPKPRKAASVLPSIHQFLDGQWLERGLSESSRNAYAYELMKLHAYLAPTPMERASEVQLREYLLAMHQRGVRAAAVRRATVVLRRYYEWLQREGHCAINPTAKLQVRRPPQKLAISLSGQELTQVLLGIAQAPARERLRDVALVHLVMGAGLRAGELLALKLSHLSFAHQELSLFGSDGARRSVPLTAEVLEAMRVYVEEGRPHYLRANTPTDYVFLTRLGMPMTASGLWKHLSGLAQRVGVQPSAFTVEALRKSDVALVHLRPTKATNT